MHPPLTYPEALSYLGRARRFGMKLGLGTMHLLASGLGRPHERLRFIHIAGTNGKGSTAAFVESCLRASGLRVGLFTSPHLISVRERIQVNRQPIGREAFACGMNRVRDLSERLGEFVAPTFFEILTALALDYFTRQKVDWVVWETGLGGRLDATNIVTPAISIITNIGRDHRSYLGNSYAEIAGEKAGIIKPGVPVVTAVQQPEARAVVVERAHELAAPLTLLPTDFSWQDLGLQNQGQAALLGGHVYKLGLLGAHQVENAACALAALQVLGGTAELAAVTGLAETRWPGRLEILREDPLTVLDGAHNLEGARRLVESWGDLCRSRGLAAPARAHLVFASVIDKDLAEIVAELRPWAAQVSLVRLANERSADPLELAELFAGLPCRCIDSVPELWQELTAASADTSAARLPVLIAGSLFLAGEILAARTPQEDNEITLNERLESSKAGL